ncbi:radical SAM/SPASM domain-containing protein [Nanoarchaeota archaeon]|nr:MAG: radical SAM/SPASM domain-containing protein [Nanoarchaeota archaeon]
MFIFFFKPKILQLEVTNDCNLNCRICMRNKSSREIGYLSLEDFKKLPLDKFKEVAFHGWGEPLLHPDLIKMISHASSIGLETSLITNGTLIDERSDEIFESGLDSIAFGIFTLKGKEKVIKNLKDFLEEKKERKSKVRTYVDITIFKDNFDEIKEIARKADLFGVDGIVLHRIFNLHDESIKSLSLSEEKELFREIKNLKLKTRVYFPLKKTYPCAVARNCIYVTWDCKQSPCCFLCELGYYLGNAHEEGIFERHAKFLREAKRNEVCRRCHW